MIKSSAFEKEAIVKCLDVMSFTTRNIETDFKGAISETSQNGIYQAVWARRADMLQGLFENNSIWKVLHIKRGIWQFDPILNIETGELIAFFSKNNFRTIRNRYFKNGTSTHYTLSLLLKNEGLYPEQEVEQLSLFDADSSEVKRKEADLVRMLGEYCEHVTKIRFLIVDYVGQEAVSASLEDYTPQFLSVGSVDISHLLPSSAGIIRTEVQRDEQVNDLVDEPQLVTLKPIVKGTL
ncbi:DUF5986 family protein [Streptococcus suis]|uniref:DUF5986 family protein n=1 Tax=Streptococcus suis TaxID=1307 RepID=UPI000CF4381A|nr:DUF5986 family protein [Streptococcus suis]